MDMVEINEHGYEKQCEHDNNNQYFFLALCSMFLEIRIINSTLFVCSRKANLKELKQLVQGYMSIK